MKRLAQSNILIIGLNGLGIEVAKNVALAGVKSITLWDPSPITIADLSSQFFFRPEDVGKIRSAVAVPRVTELNSYVPIKELTIPSLINKPETFDGFQTVVLTDASLEHQLAISDICRARNIRLIISESFGLFGSVFVDFGDKFTCYDATGKDPVSGPVGFISPTGVVSTRDGHKPALEDGDYVKFSGVEGLEALNDGEPRKVTTVKNMFSIGDVSHLGTYTNGGTYTQVKVPFNVPFKPLREQLKKPDFLISDFTKLDRPQQLHVGFQALHQFKAQHSRFPRPHNDDDANQVLQLAADIVKQSGEEITLDEKVIRELSYQASGDLAPINSVLGSFAAQEVLKSVTGKFMPLSQYLYFDATECLPESCKRSEELCAPRGSRYDNQIAVFGAEFQAKLADTKHFLVGSGAIGCEMLKVWAMMGIATGPNGHITVTDLDRIEKSNLNRQFLFRPRDLDQMKSECSARAVQEMNPELVGKITAMRDPVGRNTEHIFNRSFWEPLTSVTNALDNMEARRYVDERCVAFGKSLIDSGTMGTLGNVQVVVPFITENYSNTHDAPEESIALCTLNGFPYRPDHAIAWGKQTFKRAFTERPQIVNAYLENGTVPANLDDQAELRAVLTEAAKEKPTMESCIVWARLLFEEHFVNKVAQMLHSFPADKLASDGVTLFWAAPRRVPHVTPFDPSDPTHAAFVEAAALLCAETFGVPTRGVTGEYIVKVASHAKVPEFQVSDSAQIPTTEEEAKKLDKDKTVTHPTELNDGFPSVAGQFGMVSLEFEKDDDRNHHIDFITAASNLRAANYGIEQSDRFSVKRIAGNIIPAIATTTSLVTGLANLELIKVIDGKKDIEAFKNGYVNLATPFVTFSEPGPTTVVEYDGTDGQKHKVDTIWNPVVIDNITIQQFLDLMNREYGLSVNTITSGAILLYATWRGQAHADRLGQKVADLHVKVGGKPIPAGTETLLLTVTTEDANDEDVDLPPITVRL